jgi:hypothetical protein
MRTTVENRPFYSQSGCGAMAILGREARWWRVDSCCTRLSVEIEPNRLPLGTKSSTCWRSPSPPAVGGAKSMFRTISTTRFSRPNSMGVGFSRLIQGPPSLYEPEPRA